MAEVLALFFGVTRLYFIFGDKIMRIIKTHRLFAYLILMIVPASLVLLSEYLIVGELCLQTSDARIYISIADNFVKTGHFIQKARPYVGMVVPPGTPLMITLFRIMGLSNNAIMAVQILMFGISNVFLYETEKRITGKGFWAPAIFTLAYLRCFLRLGVVMVEHYYLFQLCFLLWLIYSDIRMQNRIISMNLVGLAMLLTRPVLLPVYCVILIYTIFWCSKNDKNLIGAGIILLPILIISINIAVNYRETGEVVLLENYSGYDLYCSSRPDAPVTVQEAAEYSKEDPVADQVKEEKNLTMSERNARFKMLARENLRNYFSLFLRNSFLRCYELFIKQYYWASIYALFGGVLLAIRELKQTNLRAIAVLVLTVLMALITSFGIIELRYSVVIWPMASVHGAYMTDWLLSYIIRQDQRKNRTVS